MNAQPIIKAKFAKLLSEGMDTKEAFNLVFEGITTWEQFAGELYDRLRERA